MAEGILAMLRPLTGITDGFAVDQLTHSVQTAALAEADDPDGPIPPLGHFEDRVRDVFAAARF